MAHDLQMRKGYGPSRYPGRFFTGKSRTAQRVEQKLGRIPGNQIGHARKVRSEKLETYEKYLNNTQYDHLLDWDVSGEGEDYVPVRKRRPRLIYNLGRTMCDRVGGKLTGSNVFPKLRVEDDPDTEEFVRLIGTASMGKVYVLDAVKKMLGAGSAFLRYYVVGQRLMIESYKSLYCYPIFDATGELEEVIIKYVYFDEHDLDERGNPKQKWYKLYLGKMADILYDNPEYVPGDNEPHFEEVARAEHQMGFVQGQWFRTVRDIHKADGPSLLCDVLGFIDALNYNLSQSDQAVGYGQEPQLVVSGMDVTEINKLIKSSQKAWNLGRNGDAKFLEADMTGVDRAMDFRQIMKQSVGDIARVVMLDPEKIVGSAQSAKAMEVLHGPLVDLVNELRPVVGQFVRDFYGKMALTILLLERRGQNFVISIPKGWKPKSLDMTISWPPIFPMTMEDMQKKVQVATTASNASLISRETLTGWLAQDFGIENVEEEIAKVAAQPVLNPFGFM